MIPRLSSPVFQYRFSTPPTYEYQVAATFVAPLTEGYIDFAVKAVGTAYIGLASGDAHDDPKYEIALGLDDNTVNAIRIDNQGETMVTSSDIVLSGSEEHRFRVEWTR